MGTIHDASVAKQEEELRVALSLPEGQRTYKQRILVKTDAYHIKKDAEQGNSKVATYKSTEAMTAGIAKETALGWHVLSTTSATPKKGALRWLAGGFVFFNRSPEYVVTFGR